MAGGWIKFDKSLPLKPEVFSLSVINGLTPDDVVGKLLRFWGWLDDNTENGIIRCYVDGQASQVIDAVVSHGGFASSLRKVGWLIVHDDGSFEVPNHDRHMGESAKARMLKSERQRRYREGQIKGSDVDGVASTDASTREEKRREENTNTPPYPPKGEGYTQEFEEWWSIYPKKIGKGAAFKAFKRAKKKTTVEKMTEAVIDHCHCDGWTKENGRYIPNPATWLNEERWNDEVRVRNSSPDDLPFFDELEE